MTIWASKKGEDGIEIASDSLSACGDYRQYYHNKIKESGEWIYVLSGEDVYNFILKDFLTDYKFTTVTALYNDWWEFVPKHLNEESRKQFYTLLVYKPMKQAFVISIQEIREASECECNNSLGVGMLTEGKKPQEVCQFYINHNLYCGGPINTLCI